MAEITKASLKENHVVLENGLSFVVPTNLLDSVKNILKFPLIASVEGNNIYVTTALLHLHTSYSLLDGGIKVKALGKKLSNESGKGNIVIRNESNDTTLTITAYPKFAAITDHGNLFGGYAFSTGMEDCGITPIIGCEVYCEDISGKKDGNHLLLLCKNEVGYHNLSALISEAEKNVYNKPHVTWEMLAGHADGIVCLSACVGGEIPQKILHGDFDGALEVAENFIDIFGEDFYIEVQNHKIEDEDKSRPGLVKLARELGIKMIATTDAHYLNEESRRAHEVLLCIGTGGKMSDPKRFKLDGEGYHVLSNQEMVDTFDFIGEAVSNQAEIVEKCQFRFKKQEIEMPHFPTGELTVTEAFEKNCWAGFEKRFNGMPINIEKYKERLNYEMSIIKQMKYEAYFLIVEDLIAYARSVGIGVGPGRGSAVGCLVSYCLRITNLDPIPYGLLFERFLNPERVSMPDIDIDFQDTRRHEVIEYVRAKYGDENVSRIITFGTLAARAVIRDAGRALEISLALVDKVAKAIPAEPGMTIDKAFKVSLEFQQLYKDPTVKNLVDIARELEGLTRHKSQHACGVIISAKPIVKFSPEVLLADKHGNVARTVAFTKKEVEKLGLLKMDFLGLRNMSIISGALDSIGVHEDNVPLNDPYVYAFLGTGDTDGIFQVESGGMKNLMKDMFSDVSLKIKKLEKKYSVKSFEEAKMNELARAEFYSFGRECFERLIAAISLYRPGPLDYIPQYVEGMRDPKSIHYDTPEVKGILAGTYGTIVYQEQVQQIVRDLAGYSLGRGDLIRRAMGDKNKEIMSKEQEIFLRGNKSAFESGKDNKFVPGCIANGVSEVAGNVIWEKMAKFAEYAFNKSHAAGYAVISVQTAWIKLYNPTIFWVETLNSVIKASNKLKKYIASAKNANVEILGPDVNKSEILFSAVGDKKIRMGLSSLRNLGKSAIPVVNERNANGEFKSFHDFVYRLMPEKKTFEALVYSGALDNFEGSRAAKIQTMEQISELKTAISAHKKMWFDIPELTEWYVSFYEVNIPKTPEMEKDDKLEREYRFAGMYVSEHPLDQYVLVTDSFEHSDIYELLGEEDDESAEEVGFTAKVEQTKAVTIIGVVKEFESKLTKKGDTMYVFQLEDTTGQIRTTVFPREVSEFGHMVRENAVIRIDGTWKDDDFGVQVVAQNVAAISDLSPTTSKAYNVYANKSNINSILSVLDSYESKDSKAVTVKVILGENEFFINSDKTAKKRAIKVDEAETVSVLRINPNLEAYATIKKITKIEKN